MEADEDGTRTEGSGVSMHDTRGDSCLMDFVIPALMVLFPLWALIFVLIALNFGWIK